MSVLLEHYFENLKHTLATSAASVFDLNINRSKKTMVRRLSSLFFRQSSQDRVAQAAADNAQIGASQPGVTLNPIQRTDFSRKTIRHVKSSGALLGTLRSLQYNTRAPTPPPPLPAQSARGLGELQECFWIEDSLHRTTLQLDRCSNQLDQIHGSAADVRRELEDLQVELGFLQKKTQLGATAAKGEETGKGSRNETHSDLGSDQRSEPKNETKSGPQNELKSEPPKPVDVTPKPPAIAKPSSIQQRIQFFSKIASS